MQPGCKRIIWQLASLWLPSGKRTSGHRAEGKGQTSCRDRTAKVYYTFIISQHNLAAPRRSAGAPRAFWHPCLWVQRMYCEQTVGCSHDDSRFQYNTNHMKTCR